MEEEAETEQAPPLLAIMGRFFPFDSEGIPFAETTLVIKEMQNQSNTGGDDGGTGLNVWDGALLLARYLEKKPDIVRNKRVLELGSGCGLVGIASGMLGAKSVIMTDLQYALPLMKENVKRNESKGGESRCQEIICKECDWYKPPPMSNLYDTIKDGEVVNPDVILVADCVWLSPLIQPLLRTLKLYTDTKTPTTVIITYQQRGRDAHEEFWQGINDMFDVKVVDTEKSAGLMKPDVFNVFECTSKESRGREAVRD